MSKLRRYTIALISLFTAALLPKKLDSCGYWPAGDDARLYVFTAGYSTFSDLKPYYYSRDKFFSAFNLWPEPLKNVEDWYNYLNKACTTDDIQAILYSMSPAEFFNNDKALLNNSFYRELLKPSRSIDLGYLKLAKHMETLTSPDAGDWSCPDCPGTGGESETDANAVLQRKLTDEVNDLFKQNPNSFIRQRLNYQLVKVAFYREDSAEVKRLYADSLSGTADSWVKYAAMLYAAQFADQVEKNLMLARVYDHCPDKRSRCIYLYSPTPARKEEKRASNNRELAILKTMRIMQYPGPALDDLKQISKLDPLSEDLPLLIVREINKLEDWLWTSEYTDFSIYRKWEQGYDPAFPNAYRHRDRQYALKLHDYLSGLIQQKSTPHKGLLELCAGYAAFLGEDFDSAHRHYRNASGLQLSSEETVQLIVTELLLSIKENLVLTAAAEQKIADGFKALDKNKGDDEAVENLRQNLAVICARILMDNGYKAKGAMLLGLSDKVTEIHELTSKSAYHHLLQMARPEDFEEVIRIIEKPDKTDFEQLIGTVCYNTLWTNQAEKWDTDKILDLKSMYYVRNDELEKALETVQRTDPGYWSAHPYDLFIYDDPFKINPWKPDSSFSALPLHWTKPRYLAEMLRLKALAKVATGNEKARLLFQLGNGYLSMTHQGKYWIMTNTLKSVNENKSSGLLIHKEHIDNYYDNRLALSYYAEALKHAKDPKLGAAIAIVAHQAGKGNKKRTPAPQNDDTRDLFSQVRSNCELYYKLLVEI